MGQQLDAVRFETVGGWADLDAAVRRAGRADLSGQPVNGSSQGALGIRVCLDNGAIAYFPIRQRDTLFVGCERVQVLVAHHEDRTAHVALVRPGHTVKLCLRTLGDLLPGQEDLNRWMRNVLFLQTVVLFLLGPFAALLSLFYLVIVGFEFVGWLRLAARARRHLGGLSSGSRLVWTPRPAVARPQGA